MLLKSVSSFNISSGSGNDGGVRDALGSGGRSLSCRPFSFLSFLSTCGCGGDDETGIMKVSVETEAKEDVEVI